MKKLGWIPNAPARIVWNWNKEDRTFWFEPASRVSMAIIDRCNGLWFAFWGGMKIAEFECPLDAMRYLEKRLNDG